MTATLTTLKANLAKRDEDLRIARKHRDEAEERYIETASESDDRIAILDAKDAARGAQRWADLCLDRVCEAREALRAEERGS